jgi:hypothetical protein
MSRFLKKILWEPYTMILGSTQPLTEMSTSDLPGGKGRPTDILTAFCDPIV